MRDITGLCQKREDHPFCWPTDAERTIEVNPAVRSFYVLQISCGSNKVFWAAEVAPVELVGAEGGDFFVGGGEAEVGVDDGEDAGFGDEAEETRRDNVDAGEGEWMATSGQWVVLRLRSEEVARGMRLGLGNGDAGRSAYATGSGIGAGDESVGVVDAAAGEKIVLVEEELAGGGALLDGEGGEGGRFFVGGEHLAEVDGGEDVDVVEEEGFV